MPILSLLNDLYDMNKNINSNRLVLRARPLPKREGLRVEIRRKAIEQYQQRVRK